MEFEGGVVLKFHFKIPFLQSCFLNDQYSSSFHVFGKQMKIKYLRLAPEEHKHMSDWSSTYVRMASLQNCAAVIILALSSGGAKRKYFLTSAQDLLRNVTLQFRLRGWITIPGFPSKKNGIRQLGFVPPPPSPSIGVGISQERRPFARRVCRSESQHQQVGPNCETYP